MFTSSPPLIVRRAVTLRGTVQGVGLRPALHRLAHAHELAGFVRNEAQAVRVEVEGAPAAVDRFLSRIPQCAPPAAIITALDVTELPPLGERGFRIKGSRSEPESRCQAGMAPIPPDLATCADCLRELFDPGDRRYRYPFLSCVQCGPRFTIVERLPYDRARTTMRTFTLCELCQREYDDPDDRRFHAEASACPACGPQLALVVAGRVIARGEEALATSASLLMKNAILAVKGIGGFALACDATKDDVVLRLRQRKLRPHKPFAVMARDLSWAEGVAVLDEHASAALVSPARPIVLAPARAGSPIAASVSPGLGDVGVFLPSSPLQELLLSDGPPLQVMTSGNAAEEPLAKDDAEALTKLCDIADAFLLHSRRITTRADDSVLRVMPYGVTPVRRARGFVPDALRLPTGGRPVLAVGGEQKSTVCFARDGEAVLSPHVGDVRHPEGDAAFRRAIEELGRLFDVTPQAVAHDLHPEYRSTRWALSAGFPLVGVQHHHAHVASCLVEHERSGPVIGLAFDGTGYGDDGALWGGECLLADLVSYRRLGHLRALPLLGGERAIREPWRLALAALHDAGEAMDLVEHLVDERRVARAAQLLAHGVVTPRATGAGRWFDAVAALCGLRAEASYDGQLAAELEAAASPDLLPPYDVELERGADESAPCVVDLRPTVRGIARDLREGGPVANVSRRFHETIGHAALLLARRARDLGAPSVVALTGGCFQNRMLASRARELLLGDRFEVLVHRRVPSNDGGLALGQAAVASARLAQGGL